MYSGGTILIASTSKAIILHIQNRLYEIEAQNKVLTAENIDELKNNLDYHRPKFLLIEASFCREGTPEEILRLVKKHMSLRIYVFGYHEYSDNYLKCLFRCGVEGFLTMRNGKGAFKDDLRNALSGKMLIPPQFEGMKFECPVSNSTTLTDRDKELIRLIFEELDNQAIAEILHIKLQSVKNRRKDVYNKLFATNIVGLLKQTIRKGFFSMEDFLAC